MFVGTTDPSLFPKMLWIVLLHCVSPMPISCVSLNLFFPPHFIICGPFPLCHGQTLWVCGLSEGISLVPCFPAVCQCFLSFIPSAFLLLPHDLLPSTYLFEERISQGHLARLQSPNQWPLGSCAHISPELRADYFPWGAVGGALGLQPKELEEPLQGHRTTEWFGLKGP